MKQNIEKTTTRNTRFPEGTFVQGDYAKIMRMTGLKRSTVIATLVYQTRRNPTVIAAAHKVALFNRKEFKS